MTEKNYRIRIKKGEFEIEVEGDKEFVEKHIEEFKQEMQKAVKEMPPEEKAIIAKEKIELEGISLAEFYKQKQPKGHNETVVVFAYWLTKRKKQQEFAPKDIVSCYNEIGIAKPANIWQFMKTLAGGRKAHLIRGDKKGIYKLSMTGDEFVEKELPKTS